MSGREDESDGAREKRPTTPVDPVDSGGFVKLFDLDYTLGSTKPLPSDLFSADTLERLRSGGQLTPDEIETLRAATSEDSRMISRLFEGLGAAGFARVDDPSEGVPPQFKQPGELESLIVPGTTQRFEWHWKGADVAGTSERKPATYYEALTGRPDPMRGFFVASRRLLDATVWMIALGVPLGLVLLGVLNGASPETIFFVGLSSLIVGLLFKHSFPRSPFA